MDSDIGPTDLMNPFSRNIAPFVEAEIKLAARSTIASDQFTHLENAHVLGQASTYWHVRTHGLMFLWSIRNLDKREFTGQIFRIIGAATKTVFGWVPVGNTGGCNVSPFRAMPIKAPFDAQIRFADRGWR